MIPPVPSVMPKPLDELDAVPLEEAEDPRDRDSRRRTGPSAAAADDAPHRRPPASAPGPAGVDPLQALLVELGPADGDADEARRLDPGQEREERLDGGIAGEDVGPAPVDGPEHLEITAERVVERQEAQEDLVVPDLGQGRRPGEPLGDELVDREAHALGLARAARGEHDRGDLVQGPTPPPGQGPLDLGAPRACRNTRPGRPCGRSRGPRRGPGSRCGRARRSGPGPPRGAGRAPGGRPRRCRWPAGRRSERGSPGRSGC